jgi:riboflavin synthase
MFTGLIEEIGLVRRVGAAGGARRLAIEGKETLLGLAVGQSIAIDGTCMTVTLVADDSFEVDVSAETLSRTTLGRLREADRVNLERPCRPTDRLGGHIVTGHIDAVGTIMEARQEGETWRFVFSYPERLGPLLVPKGSIAVDGISLTIAELTDTTFGVAVIPHTYRKTTLGRKQVGHHVNLETDILGKYVVRYLETLGAVGTTWRFSESFLSGEAGT